MIYYKYKGEDNMLYISAILVTSIIAILMEDDREEVERVVVHPDYWKYDRKGLKKS